MLEKVHRPIPLRADDHIRRGFFHHTGNYVVGPFIVGGRMHDVYSQFKAATQSLDGDALRNQPELAGPEPDDGDTEISPSQSTVIH
jgi:hypothetical protein